MAGEVGGEAWGGLFWERWERAGRRGGGGPAAGVGAGWRARQRGLLPYGDCVLGGDQDQFIGLAQAVAVVFGIELGKAETGLGHFEPSRRANRSSGAI